MRYLEITYVLADDVVVAREAITYPHTARDVMNKVCEVAHQAEQAERMVLLRDAEGVWQAFRADDIRSICAAEINV